MLHYINKKNSLISLLSIVLSNLVVVYGVLFLGWNFFMVIYSYWFSEFISALFNRIKIRTLKNRKEYPPTEEQDIGSFLFLFVYWVFIVVIAGFVAAKENFYMENLKVIFFLNKHFDFNLLLLLLGEFTIYYRSFYVDRDYSPQQVVSSSGLMNKRTMIMHISIIFGTFAWFSMHSDQFFFRINPGKYGDSIFMMVFVFIRLTGEILYWNRQRKK